MIRGLERIVFDAEERHLAALKDARDICAMHQVGKVTAGTKKAAMERVEVTERAYLDAMRTLGEANIKAARVILGVEAE